MSPDTGTLSVLPPLGIIAPIMLLTIGFCIHAAISHLSFWVYSKRQWEHLTITLISIASGLFLVITLLSYKTTNYGTFVIAAKIQGYVGPMIFPVVVLLILMHAGKGRRLHFAYFLLALSGVLCVANYFCPFGIFLSDVTSLTTMTMPWGETVTRPVGKLSPWMAVVYGDVFLTMLYGFIVLPQAYRETRHKAIPFILAAMALFSGAFVVDIFIDLGLIRMVYLSDLTAGLIFGLIIWGMSQQIWSVLHEANTKNQALNADLEHRVEQRTLELTRVLGEIKTLRGILPICSHCNKIRDDAGSWEQLEAYVQAHSEAEFSHSLCPQCVEKHYPNLPAATPSPPQSPQAETPGSTP